MRPRLLARLLPFAVLAGCNPNWEPAASAREKPPEWEAPPQDEGHGRDGAGGGSPSMARIIETLEAKIAADPNDVESMRQLAQALDEIGEWDRAAEVLLDATKIAPQDVSLKVLRARVLLQRKDQGAALAELEAAKKIAPDDERLLRAWASYWILAEDMAQAVAVRKRLLAKHPKVADAETIEREIYYLSRFPKLKDEGKLKDFFDAAGAAKVQARAGRWDEATATLQKVLALLPDDPEHWTDLGIAQRKSGKKEEGIASFKKALSFDKNHSATRVELARALAEDGDARGAIRVLQEWQKIDSARAGRHEVAERIARLERGEPFDAAGGTAVAGSPGKPGTAGGAIQGIVRIAPEIADKVPKSAALFVMAKKSPADRMPLAVKRLVGASFPATFELTSAESMAGGELSGEVWLTARIEVDGQMGSGPGDLEGVLAKAVPVGSGNVVLVIDTLVGSGAGTAPAAAAATPPPSHAFSASGNRIRGTIDVAPALAAKMPRSGTLYIFAKANPGPGAPLAVVRRPLPPTFPFEFELSEEDTMMEGIAFEGSVYLTARIDQDGMAGASPGDLEGVSKSPVPVGTDGVALTIDTVK